MPKPGYLLYLTEEEASWLSHALSLRSEAYATLIGERLDNDALSTDQFVNSGTALVMARSGGDFEALARAMDDEKAREDVSAVLRLLTDESERHG